MPSSRTLWLAALSMAAFAANSLLCRLALRSSAIDAASYTTLRLVSGALALWLIVRVRQGNRQLAGSWASALAWFVYAAGFSFAYLRLPTASGALILFGSVQATMISYGLWHGEKLRPGQIIGLCVALGGLISLLLPGLSAPPPGSAAIMACAGVAWGTYSLRGRGAGNPAAATAGNFVRAVPFTLVLSVVMATHFSWSSAGVWCAVTSGVLASGVGCLMWYSVLPRLTTTNAAIIQLSVPVLAAIGGVVLLSEAVTVRLVGSSLAILGGIALAISSRRLSL